VNDSIENCITSEVSVSDDEDSVADDEILYRSIRAGRGGEYYIDQDGILRFTSQAFNDKSREPSVDRAKMRNNNPTLSKKSPSDGIVSLVTSEIRAEKVPVDHSQNNNPTQYILDVIPKRLPDNDSHAVIVPNPEYKNDKAYKRVKEKLAYLAGKHGWTVTPME